jgi:serine O-acetyltransferase
VFEYIRADIRELTRYETGVLMKLGVILLHLGLHAVLLYRAARWLHLHHMRLLAVLISYFSSVLTGAQISPRAAVGKGLVIYHPHGIMIGATAVLGEYCILVHGNVIGQLYGGGDRPVIGNHFVAATGAKMLGRIRIGDKVRVGPNAVVTQSLPDGVTVAGNPARIIRDRVSPDAGSSIAGTAAEGPSPDSHSAVVPRLAAVIARSVDVVSSADAIGEDTVLLGEGIGLDSINLLRVVSEVEEEFGLTLDESELKTWHLQTVGSLAAFIEKQLSR